MSERVVKCPICYDEDRCFEDTQKTFVSYLCFNCGFMSHSDYTKEWEGIDSVLANSPKLVCELKAFDESKKIFWFPSVINMGPRGIIYPEGDVENWNWKYAKVVDIPEEERKNFPIPNKEGEFYETQLDVKNSSKFGQYEFLEACKEMGIARDIK